MSDAVLQLVSSESWATFVWPASLLQIGNASYSIYLVYGPLMSLMSHVACELGPQWAMDFAVQVLACLGAGTLYYFQIVKRSISMINAAMGKDR